MIDCNVEQVKSYFEGHKTSTLRFAGMVFNESSNSQIRVSFQHESDSSVLVELYVELPAYFPPAPDNIE